MAVAKCDCAQMLMRIIRRQQPTPHGAAAASKHDLTMPKWWWWRWWWYCVLLRLLTMMIFFASSSRGSPCWLVVPLGCVRARFSFFPTLIYATNNNLSPFYVCMCVCCAPGKRVPPGDDGSRARGGGIKMKTQPFYAQRRIYSSNNNNNKKEKSGYSTTSAKKGYTGDREEEVILCVLCAL